MSKTFAVTGVASGIGAEIARLLKVRGDRVIGFDLTEVSTNVDHFIPLDLADDVSFAKAAASVTEPLDGLCNNAGVPPRPGLEQVILRVNFLGQRRFTKAMLPHFRPGASLVNMASRAGAKWHENLLQNKRLATLRSNEEIAGFVAGEGIEATRCYNLSKEAMILWTMALNEGLAAQGYRANSISPGAIATGILDDFARAFGDKMARNVERAGRPGTPQEVAEVAVFLLSEESACVKGVDLAVDGGMGAFNLSDALDLDEMLLSETA